MTITEIVEPGELLTAVKRKVAIQGYPGSFHDIAAHHYFAGEGIELVTAATFNDLVDYLGTTKTADTALMAIENSIAGSIMGNYQLLLGSRLKVTGEIYLRIRQNLLALPGQKVEDLTEVYSHPMALAQCETFFRQHPHIKLIEAEDTALSAKLLKDKGLRNAGAIASEAAGKLYGLEMLAESIETNKKNYTRFLVLERQDEVHEHGVAEKVSLCFSVAHEVGSLHRLLSVLAAYDLNLTKIQSSPILGKQWEYFFFVDFVANGRVDWEAAVEAIRPLTMELKVLGAYSQGSYFE